jgi:hypothetical protein
LYPNPYGVDMLNESIGHGLYYGSDGLRSPLDKYRAPGTPAYEE